MYLAYESCLFNWQHIQSIIGSLWSGVTNYFTSWIPGEDKAFEILLTEKNIYDKF